MRAFTRLLPVLVLVLVLAWPAASQELRRVDDNDWCDDSRGGDGAHHCFVVEATLDAEALKVRGDNGSVSVEAWDGDRVRVRVRVTGHARSDERAQEIAEAIQVSVARGDISADGPNAGRNEWWGASYRIDVPRNTDLDLGASNGSVKITGVSGRIRFDTENGSVELRDLGGDVQGRTQNGGVRVELSGSTWQGEGLEVRTQNGGVRVAVPESYNAVLETGTVNGGVRVGFDTTMKKTDGKRMTLELGSGGPTLKITTVNGGVRIERR